MQLLREIHLTYDGMSAASASAMTTRTNRPSEAWTIPFHIVMWAVITVGFIMALVVVMLH